MEPFRPDQKRRVLAEEQTGRLIRLIGYPGFRSCLAPPGATVLPPLRGSS